MSDLKSRLINSPISRYILLAMKWLAGHIKSNTLDQYGIVWQ